MASIILQIALAISPFFLKYGLFLIDKFIKDAADKDNATKAVIAAANKYNSESAEMYNARQEYITHMEEYLALVKAEQAKKSSEPAILPQNT